MGELLTTLQGQLAAFSVSEVIAVVLAIAYLVLVIRQNILCWVCAIISSGIYVWLFIDAKLYMESLLYLFYVGMAVYGWRSWAKGGRSGSDLPVVFWPGKTHAIAIVVILSLATVSGFLLERYTDAAYPYIDSITSFAAVWGTFLVARKVFENWWYWLVIDVASVFIYWERGLELTALLFVLYVALIPVGMLQWMRSARQQTAAEAGA